MKLLASIPLLVMAVFAVLNLHAQSQNAGETKIVQYSYDASGNRISRAIVTPAKSPASIGDSIKDSFENITITATPNPTSGPVKIELSGMEYVEELMFGVYSLEGACILQGNILESIQLDISPYQSGWYIINIYKDYAVKSTKILKIQ